jgi:putative PEP-CTERM system TPR-repeat lipoprotein
MKMRTALLGYIAVIGLCVAACSDPQVAKQRAFERGNQYFNEKKYAEAIVEYRNAIRRDARFGEARLKLAESYEHTGNARAAFTEQIRAADLLPQNTAAQLKAVNYLLVAGRFQDAKTRVQKVLDREPMNVDALILLGSAMAGLKDVEGAVTQVEQALTLEPSNSQGLVNLASLKFAQGDRDQARAAFEKAVQLDPKSIPARVALANFQWGTGDRAGAEQSFKAALAIDPKHVLANRALTAYYIESGRPAEAEPYVKTLAENGGQAAKVGLADYYINVRRLDEATKVLKPLAEGTRPLLAAQVRLAQIAYAQGHHAEAHTELDKVLKRDATNPTALLLNARWFFAERKLQDSLKQATAAVAAAPESAQAHYLLGTVQAALGDFDGGTKSFTEVLRINPRASQAQLQLSRLQLAHGDAAAAVLLAQQAVQNAPKYPPARLALAQGLVMQRQTSRASTEIAALLKDYPNAAPVHAVSGALKATTKDYRGARAEYSRAAELDPKSLEALNGLTLLDLAEKNVASARARVDKRLAAEPDNPEVLSLAGRVYLADNDPVKSEQTFRHLIEVQPSNIRGYTLLGQLYLLQHKVDAAKAEFEQRARLNPKDVSAHTMLAMILEVQKNVPEAKKKYEEVLSIDGRAAVAANNLAYLYADSGENLDRALNLAQTAVEQMPDNPAVQDTLGWVYYKKQLPDLAIRAFGQSIAKDPSNPLYHYHLGLAYVRGGNIAGARDSLGAALKLKPDYADARKALQSVVG